MKVRYLDNENKEVKMIESVSRIVDIYGSFVIFFVENDVDMMLKIQKKDLMEVVE